MNYTVKDLEQKLNKSRYQVMRMAKEYNWQVVKVAENGTTKNYYLASDVEKSLGISTETKENATRTLTVIKKEAVAVDELPEWNQRVAWARYMLCLKLDEAYEERGELKEVIIKEFVNRAFEDYPEQMKVLKRISVPTLRRWFMSYSKSPSDPLALCSKHGTNKGLRNVNKEVLEDVKSLYLSKNKPKMTYVYERIVLKHGTEAISYGTLRNYIKYDLNSIEKDRGRMGKKEFRDMHDFYIERDYSTLEVNEMWVSDGHDLEMSCFHPYEKTSRGERKVATPKLVIWMDMRSRMITGWTLSWGETAESIAIALKNGIEHYGKPKQVYTDNGKAYRGKVLKGTKSTDDGLDGIYAALGIKARHAIVRNAQAKPIERWFLDFKESFTKNSLTYKGGHILERKEDLKDILKDKILKGKILEYEELKEYISEWVKYKNHMYYAIRRMAKKKAHRGDSMNNMTPLEVFNTLPINKRKMLTAEQLRLLFLYEDIKTIQQNGVTYLGNTYRNEHLFFHLKEQVKIKYDPHNLEYIYVYLSSGEFLCKADKINKSGFGTVEEMKEHKRLVKKVKKLENNLIDARNQKREVDGMIEFSFERREKLEKEEIKPLVFKEEKKKKEKKSIKIADGMEIIIDD
ncbi:integrase [Fusobacterium ulcerans]|uniref:Mu transposase, C-terminal n=1 Tax=Fusobacterium ulcerans TaxID=861 RepID=A0AAX2JCC6_9FUSO|nr:Mu transposase C-terminal domain-containing protein [Fusobacterium ulcerans]AVQ26913.1 integrase [Fusobacterium ulcerans]EFS24958.1 hypothetical protein FUAG_00473 [Fusobacterium ulcerans ATCC 49185]SQJ09284.1 Mu transposase, C-terminal [Fusobacterium ulcerans]